MARQEFYSPKRSSREEESSQDEGWSSNSLFDPNTQHATQDQADRLAGSSSQAQGTLDDIDDLLADSEAEAAPTPESATAVSDATNKTADGKELGQREGETATANSGRSPFTYQQLKEKHGKKEQKGYWTKKRVGIAGGITGLVVGGGMFGGTFLVGPLQFVHFAQRLQGMHFITQENNGDSRVGKLYRYLRKGGDPGQTRLTWIESKYNDRMIKKMGIAGLTPVFDSAGFYKSIDVQINDKSPYKGLNKEQAIAAMEKDYGGKAFQYSDGKFRVQQVGENYRTQKGALKTLMRQIGASKVGTSAGSRVLARYGLVSWRPMDKANKAITRSGIKAAEYFKKKWANFIKKGVTSPVTITAGGKEDTGTVDSKGNPITEDLDGTTTSEATKNSKSILKEIAASKTAKITGGIAAVAGLACGLKAVDDGIADIRYAQVMVPLMRLSLSFIAVGNQVMLGKDVDQAELAYLSRFFTELDKNGDVVSSASSAMSLQAAEGNTGGQDMSAEKKALLSQQKPAWLDWTQNGVMSTVCSTPVQVATGIFSIGVGIISGQVASTVVGFIVGAVATGPAIEAASGLLAGDGIDILKDRGAQFGADLDYGARYGANAAATKFGGVELTNAQVLELDKEDAATRKEEFQSQSFFARMFNPYDYRSLTASVIDSQSSTLKGHFAGAFQNLFSMAGSLAKLPTSLFSGTAHAQTVSYNYGFPKVGFSNEDMNNPLVENPYDNAEAAAKLFENDGSNGYIAKAASCFGVTISKGGQGWQVVGTTDVNIYDKDKRDPLGCNDKSDDWLRVRFFIMDSGTFDGYACVELDDNQACTNNGANTTSNSINGAASPANATAPPAGSVSYEACNKVATGNGKIVCSAYLFDALSYSQDGPRGKENWAFIDCAKTNFAGAACSKYPDGVQRTVDCSSLVSFAIYDATKIDIGAYNTGAMLSSSKLQKISDDQGQPGDILLRSGHTEVIVSNDKTAKKFSTFGAHQPYADHTKDVSAAQYGYGEYSVYRVIP